MKESNDDHLPPQAGAADSSSGPKGRSSRAGASAPLAPNWGDRALFAALGVLFGFAAAYVYLDKVPSAFVAPGGADPHAGLTADAGMPGMPAAAANPAAANPATRQQVAEIEQAIAASEGKYDQLVQLGNRAYDLNAHPLAVVAYEKALAIRGDDPNVLTDAGTSLRSSGNTAKALEYFERALQKDPKHWQALFNVVVVYGFDKGDPATARKRLGELKALKATHPEMPPLDQLEAELLRASGGSK